MIRPLGVALTCAALVTAASAASAQGADVLGAYGGAQDRERFRTGQEFLLELRVQQYIPDVDSAFDVPEGTKGPYEFIFYSGRRYAVGFEFDWQAFRIPYVGTLGPGYGFLYTRSTAPAPFTEDPLGPRSGQDTSLTILPMYLVAVLRVDVLWNEFGIPFAPYAKGGVGWAMWWAALAGDTEEVATGTPGSTISGQGTTFGYQWALGGALLLDFFDEEAAGEMDNSIGVNHSYIFAEWYVSKLEGGGIFSKQMYVGTNSWAAGLAFEF